jgi:hypothetical protein
MSFFEPVELIADPIAAYQFTQQMPPPEPQKQSYENSNPYEVLLLILFVMFFFVSLHCSKRNRRDRKDCQQELIRSQQIEMLERMWTISPNR